MAVKRAALRRAVLSLLILTALCQLSEALRGAGLPNRELFGEDPQPPKQAVRPPSGSSNRSEAAATNATAGLTVSGLKDELDDLKDKVEDAEHRHSKATIAAAATIGSLLLLIAVGCAGALVYRRCVSSQHAGKKNRADKLPYYDADRLLGDPPGL